MRIDAKNPDLPELFRPHFVSLAMNRILVSFLLAAATALAADISGEWEFAAKMLGGTDYFRVTLKTDGKKFSGNLE